jgi:hypothetical protein
MLNKIALLTIGICCFLPAFGKAMIGEEERSAPQSSHIAKKQEYQHLRKDLFSLLPKELIIKIADYLYEEHFHNYAQTCKPMRKILMEKKSFFISETKEEIKKIIETTPLQGVSNLILQWSRTPRKKSISLIKSATCPLENYEKVSLDVKKEDLKTLKRRFENHVKHMNILYGMGYKEVKKEYKKIYGIVQYILSEERAKDSKLLYTFHLKNFSLLRSETRKEISRMYLEEKWPFQKDKKKSEKYCKDLHLPLSRF